MKKLHGQILAFAHSRILHFAFEMALCFSSCKIGSNQKDWTGSDLVAPNGPEPEPEGSCSCTASLMKTCYNQHTFIPHHTICTYYLTLLL
jgi:hypothetical protein